MERKLAMRLVNKLLDAGFTDDKAISSMTMEKLTSIPNLSISDINGIILLQKAIKSNSVIKFLAGHEIKVVKEDGSQSG